MTDDEVRSLVARLDSEYDRLHVAKEDAFWAAYMDLTDHPQQARETLGEREIELQRFLQDPARRRSIEQARQHASTTGPSLDADLKLAIEGWCATFAAHGIDSAEGQAISEEIVHQETALAAARGAMELGYTVPGSAKVRASSVELGGMLRTDPDPVRRRAAWEGLRDIERHVLASGFCELVRNRNRLGRSQGGEDYYDWKTRRTEGMSKREIFELLDELEVATRDAGQRALSALRARPEVDVTPWNVLHAISGEIRTRWNPYFPFSESFDRWGRSFTAMGCRFRGATLVLDLLDRPGKYENGFMHGPVTAWRRPEGFRAARIHFTANAIPKQIGAGQRALETLFHEGGHAVHFANIDMPSPCFAQEFAPTSVAYAEIQSMFMDALIGDADWLRCYARNLQGEAPPFELIQAGIEAEQPFAAWSTRAMLVVPYAERAIYELPDEQLNPDNVLRVCREVERKLLGQESHRPVLSVPHLLAGESSAYYHGYVLAEMGVHQTRAWFQEHYGRIVDEPAVGPTLCQRYWAPGNRYTLHTYLQRMTGDRLSPHAMAQRLNRSVADAITEARQAYDRVAGSSGYTGPVELDAAISVVHGRQTIADTRQESFESAASRFRDWIQSLS